MKFKMQIALASALVGFCSYVIYDIAQELTTLRKTNIILETNLKEKSRHIDNISLVCSELNDPMGEIVQLDCGESFAPRHATCACTLWCLDDYSFVINNRSPEDCKAAREENL
tara:strand:+ start:697 stop:1035 length:339 start_codon:yes stop_codon:yes gene_type:complete